MKFTNVSAGPRGLNTKTGTVLVEAGQTVDHIDIEAAERKVALASGWFVEGDAPKSAEAANGDLAALQAAVAERDATIADLNKAVTDRDQVIDNLKTQLAALQAIPPTEGAAVFAVLDKGRGWWAITQGDKEVTKSLREDDVKEFDKLSDADKLAFVDLHKPD